MLHSLLSRRTLLAAGAAAFATPALAAPKTTPVTVFKTPWCGCCGGWVKHMAANGFRTTVVELEDLAPVRAKYGVPDAAASCHTGLVAGYALEGHVPAGDVRKLLKDRPRARGLAVPGMPLGSPGMERPDGQREPYNTLLILRDGSTKVFASHA
jgi:hypothetical protein